MRLVVNGESQELPAATLADALQSLNFAEATELELYMSEIGKPIRNAADTPRTN